MDVRLSAEQRALRDSAAQLVADLAPRSVMDLGNAERATKLDAAIDAVGWRELRTDGGDGRALASGVEAALVAEELARGLADASFLGPTLAAELRRLAGAPAAAAAETVVLTGGLSRLATAAGDGTVPDAVAIDARGCGSALLLISGAAGAGLGWIETPQARAHADLTRLVADVGGTAAARIQDQRRPLTSEQLARWSAFAIAMTCADLVGTMTGAVQLACEYAKVRCQYGVPIGAFQAIQHKLADAFVATEGSRSVALHAAWAADALPARDARLAAAVAKAYCSRAARSVCEAAIQVHGGIGNTWESTAHLYLRRALFTSEMLGGAGPSLAYVLSQRIEGAADGLR
jgi:alkylation response protein AidB-like acyl-CoA dehydrogenase